MSNAPSYGGRFLNPESSANTTWMDERSLSRLGILLGIGGFSYGVYRAVKYYWNKNYDSAGALHEDTSILANAKEKPKWVILHQCPRGYTLPCISPFPLKLETFLRISKIPYEVNIPLNSDSDARDPWMTFGDVMVYNSHECIPYLCETFNVNLEAEATPSRMTASRLAGVMLDNHIYWAITLWRWVYAKGGSLPMIQPFCPNPQSQAITEVSDSVRRAAFYTGLGRLPFEKLVDIVVKDLADLSAALGKHQYFLGEKPGEIDCTAFSLLAQILWAMPNSPFEARLKFHKNLVEFVYRMRETYWDNWLDILSNPSDAATLGLGNKPPIYPMNEFAIRMSRMSLEGAEEEFVPKEDPIGRELSSRSNSSSRTSSRSKSSVRFSLNLQPPSKNLKEINNEAYEIQQQIQEFDDFNELKNVQEVLDQLNYKLEKKAAKDEEEMNGFLEQNRSQTFVPTMHDQNQSQTFVPTSHDHSQKQLKNVLELLDQFQLNHKSEKEKVAGEGKETDGLLEAKQNQSQFLTVTTTQNQNQLKKVQELLDEFNHEFKNEKEMNQNKSELFMQTIHDRNQKELKNLEQMLDQLHQKLDFQSNEQKKEIPLPTHQQQYINQDRFQNEQFVNHQGQYIQQDYDNIQYVPNRAQSRPNFEYVPNRAQSRPNFEYVPNHAQSRPNFEYAPNRAQPVYYNKLGSTGAEFTMPLAYPVAPPVYYDMHLQRQMPMEVHQPGIQMQQQQPYLPYGQK